MTRIAAKPNAELAKRLCEARLAFGFKERKEFAIHLGILPNTLGNYETGFSEPKVPVLILYKNIGISLDWLLTGEGDMLNSGGETLPHDKKAGKAAMRKAIMAVETGLAGAKLTPDKKAELIDLSTALLQEGKAEYLRKIITLLVKIDPAE